MIKVGILGTGLMGREHLRCYSALDKVEILAIAGRDRNKAEKLASQYNIKNVYTSYSELIRNGNVEVIDICLPTLLHKEFTIKAAKSGKHILCEKPIALNLEDAEEMIYEVKKAGVKFMVAHVLRFWPEYLAIKSTIDQGRVGEIYEIFASRFNILPVWSVENWIMDESQSGGVVVDLMIHDFDFIYWLLGSPKSIHSFGIKNQNGFWIQVLSVMKYSETKIAYVEGAYLMPEGSELNTQFRLYGEKGIINMNNQFSPSVAFYSSGKEEEFLEIPPKDGYLAEIEYFINCILEDKEPKIISSGDAVTALKLALQAKKSLETGKEIIL
jgi:predicted dehydrogenase